MKRKETLTLWMNLLVCLPFISLISVNAVASDNLDEMVKSISKHLEFVGYTLKNKENIVFVEHPIKRPFHIKKYNGGLLFRAIYTAKKLATEKRAAYLGLINSLNAEATVCRFYADKDNDFVFETWINHYDKASFGRFFEQWEKDTYWLMKGKLKVIVQFVK